MYPGSSLSGGTAAPAARGAADARQILRAYPYLEAADIDEALRYAASLAEDETIEFGD